MRKRKVRPRLAGVMTITMICVFIAAFSVAWKRLNLEKAALAGVMDRYYDAAAEISELKSELSYVKTNVYIERAARDELGMLFPGEYRYVAQ